MKIKRIYIEITNICNLNCSFCLNHQRKFESMSIEKFEEIILSIKDLCDYVYLHVQGEPLNHPNFYKILDICEANEMKVQLVTNGTFINKYDSLINYECLRKVSFSLHSIDYQSIEIDEYMNDIFNFISTNKNSYIELRFWNKDNLSLKSQQCLDIIKDKYELIETNKINSYKLDTKLFLHFDNQFQWPDKNSDPCLKMTSCHGGVNMIGILVDGTVVPCCLDAKGSINLGNIFNEDINQILQSERYIKLVKGFQNRNISEDFCKKCTYRLRFK